MDGFLIKDLDHNTLSLYKNCFDLNDSPKELDTLKWQFFQNPVKKAYVNIVYDPQKEKVAAIYAISCALFKIGSTTVLGTQSLDTITDVNYRGQGLFIKSALDVYQKAKDNNINLVYGFPNGNSIYGFKNKLGWRVLDPVPFLIKPLKSRYFTNRIPFLKFLPNINLSFNKFKTSKHYTIKVDSSFPGTVNKIWGDFSADINVAVHRNKEYLVWRYIDKPGGDYKIAHCYDINNNYIGFIVYTIKGKHGGKIAYIMELIYNLNQPNAANHLMEYAINEIKKVKADCILSWCLEHSPNYNVFKRSRFLNLPEKLRPIELHFGVRTLDSSEKEKIEDRKNWYLSYSDSDTV